jgi:hypothetical protein
LIVTPAAIKSRFDFLRAQYSRHGDGVFGLRAPDIEKLGSLSSIVDACLCIDPTGEKWPISPDEISKVARIVGMDPALVAQDLESIAMIASTVDAIGGE